MTAPVAPCLLHIEPQVLSAWRDGLLSQAEAERISGHVAGCAACQAHLRTFESTAAILRAQPVLNLRESVWRGTQSRIAGSAASPRRQGSPRALLGSLGAVAAVLLIVALFGVLLHGRGPAGPGISATPQATNTPVLSPTPTVLPGTIPPGWQGAGLLVGGDAAVPLEGKTPPSPAFAPSNAVIGYVCAMNASATQVATTTDGGRTWRPQTQRCDGSILNLLSVDPTNPNDVLLATTSQPSGVTSSAIYRSTDGGTTWARQSLSLHGSSLGSIGWAGSTALLDFVAGQGQGTQTPAIYASIAGGPFTRLDANGQINGTPLGPQIIVAGTATAIYVEDRQGSTFVSTNGGKTWTTRTWQDHGATVIPLAYTSDGNVILALESNGNGYVVSADGGSAWRALPAFPEQGDYTFFQPLPDGSVLLYFGQGARRLYLSQPNASAWATVLSVPQQVYPQTFTWNAQGHLAAIWATYQPDPNTPSSRLIWHELS